MFLTLFFSFCIADYLHSQGIIYRDLKPAPGLTGIRQDGRLRLLQSHSPGTLPVASYQLPVEKSKNR